MTKHILMIKKCMATGLMYLCKTSRKDPYLYPGSGVYWKKHIKKHKSHIITCVVGEFDTPEKLKCKGLALSESLDVVNSPQWANFVPEQGDGGWINDQTGNHWKVSKQGRENMCRSRRENRENYKRGRQAMLPKISSGNNYQSQHYIHTPWGTFETYKDAIREAKRLRLEEGRKDVVTDRDTLRKYCESCIILNIKGRRTFLDWRGNETTQLGFYKVKK